MGHSDPEYGSTSKRGLALHAVPHDASVLAHAGCPSHRAESPFQRHRRDHRTRYRVPRLQLTDAEEQWHIRGDPFPDGSKMAKIHWNPKKLETFPGATVPGTQHDVDFMEKDSKRFADSGGWGWAVFDYDAASDTFTPGTLADKPPQGNDAKCGFACHTTVKNRDYVFTDYGHR